MVACNSLKIIDKKALTLPPEVPVETDLVTAAVLSGAPPATTLAN